LFCHADTLVTDRLALWMEFCRGLHLWRPGVGTRRAASHRGRNTDRLTTMDGGRLWTGIFDLGHRHGGHYVGRLERGWRAAWRNCPIHAQPKAGLTNREANGPFAKQSWCCPDILRWLISFSLGRNLSMATVASQMRHLPSIASGGRGLPPSRARSVARACHL